MICSALRENPIFFVRAKTQRFQDGNFHLEDDERPRQPKKFEDDNWQKTYDQIESELASTLEVTQQAIFIRLRKLEKKFQKRICVFRRQQSRRYDLFLSP